MPYQTGSHISIAMVIQSGGLVQVLVDTSKACVIVVPQLAVNEQGGRR